MQQLKASAVSDIVGNDEVKIIETSHHEGFESVKQRVLMLTAKVSMSRVENDDVLFFCFVDSVCS